LFSFHLTQHLLLHYLGKTDLSIICVTMNEKTTINSIYFNLWAQQPVYYKVWTSYSSVFTKWSLGMFVKSRSDWYSWIGLEQNIINTDVNELRKHLLACVRIVGQHFKQFYCGQLKNEQLDDMLTKVSEM